MEEDFYRGKLERDYGLKVLVPDAAGRAEVNRVIYEELVRGIISENPAPPTSVSWTAWKAPAAGGSYSVVRR
jgi:aspartate/glutamate racemase